MNRIGAVLLSLFAVLLPSPQADSRFELIFAGGRVVDGTGAPWFVADVGVRDGRIAAVGPLGEASATRRGDARNLVVAPGFIQLLGQCEFSSLVAPRDASTGV